MQLAPILIIHIIRMRGTFFFLGVLCERKGVYNLLQAIKLLDPQIDKTIKLYLCGDGEMEKVKQMIKELGISHRIAHLGWIVGEQKNFLWPMQWLMSYLLIMKDYP